MTVQEINLPNLQLIISYPVVDYLDWKFLNNGLQNLFKELDGLLTRLNLRERTINNTKATKVTPESFTYKNNLNTFYWYLLHVNNPFIYNEYLDKLIAIHIDNLEFAKAEEVPINKTKTKLKKEKTVKRYKAVNKWFREVRIDIFTNKEIYTYYNPKTKEEFTSDDPNKLDELNAELTKRTRKVKKVKDVPALSNIVFNFNKKTNE